MTTGNIAVDRFVNVPNPDSPGNTVGRSGGSYYSKWWTGQDYPKVDRSFRFSKPQGAPSRGWKPAQRKKRRLDMVPHNYSMRAVMCQADLLEYKGKLSASDPWPKKGQWVGVYQQGLPGTVFTGSDPWTVQDQNALLGTLRENIAGSDFNAGVFLAEMPEAFRMISGSATNLADAIRRFRRGDFVGAARALSRGSGNNVRPSNRWLELQYGWLPLLQDMEGGARFIASAMYQPVIRVTATRQCMNGFSGYGAGMRDYLQLATLSDYTWGTFVLDFAGISGVRSKRIVAYLKAVDKLELSGLKDPLSVAWEVVPFSFIVDWAFPIGQYLANLSLDRALTATFITTDYWRVEGSGITISAATPNRHLKRIMGGNTARTQAIQLDRTVTTGLDIPRPSLKGAASILSLRRAISSLALLDSAFAGGRR